MGRSRSESRRAAKRGKGKQASREWQLQDAKARFSELFRLARESGPQRVTKHGREAVVVIGAEEYAQITGAQKRVGSLAQFFALSPLRGCVLELKRQRDFGRAVDL